MYAHCNSPENVGMSDAFETRTKYIVVQIAFAQKAWKTANQKKEK